MSDRASDNAVPAATLAAADHADPDWWEGCAFWHEIQSANYLNQRHIAGDSQNLREAQRRMGEFHSAAALACRAFAEMMRRADADVQGRGTPERPGKATWFTDPCGNGTLSYMAEDAGHERTLPQAVADALREEAT